MLIILVIKIEINNNISSNNKYIMNELFEYFQLYTVKKINLIRRNINHNTTSNDHYKLENNKKYIIIYAKENNGYNILGINYIKNMCEYPAGFYSPSCPEIGYLLLRNGYYFSDEQNYSNPIPSLLTDNCCVKIYQLIDDFKDAYIIDLITTHYSKSTKDNFNLCIHYYRNFKMTLQGYCFDREHHTINDKVTYLIGKKNIDNKTNIIPCNRI